MGCFIRILMVFVVGGAIVLPAVGHPLSQFSVNHFNTLEFRPGTVRVHTLIDIAELPSFRELGLLDTDNNSRLTRDEIDAYLGKRVPGILSALSITVRDRPVPLKIDHSDLRLYSGLARVTCMQILAQFSGELPDIASPTDVQFQDDSFPENQKDFGQIRLRAMGGLEIPAESIRRQDSRIEEAVPETSDTWLMSSGDVRFILKQGIMNAGLESTIGFDYVDTLVSPTIIPPETLSFNANGLIPILRSDKEQPTPQEQISTLQPRAIQAFPELPSSTVEDRPAPQAREDATQAGERELGELIHRQDLSFWVVVVALALAAFYGAGHALTPGHGKTVVAAYLVGSRGTIWHAIYLGLIVTLTHMGSVFIIGFIALYLQSSLIEGNLIPVMEGVSGLLITAIGLWMFLSRYRNLICAKTLAAVGASPGQIADHHHSHPPHDHHDHHNHSHGPHDHAHGDHDHSHDHHSHSHSHHDHSHVHHHGHSHEIPANASLWDLLVLGISGGMVPCPTAIVVLMVAIGIGRTAFGMLLIAAFSFGLAAVLIVIGVLMVSAKHFLDRLSFGGTGKLVLVLPVFSGALISCIGLWLTVYALIRGGIITIHL